ncbi:MAG: carboxypeptidase M32 [Alphaproteobacteria bacterium]|nr:carboxypeptidase M32 [Alphaproteobacteria bacterium]
MSSAYARLTERFARLGVLGDTLGILQWDTATTMPPGASDARGEQVSVLHLMRHELLTDRHIGDWLDAAASDAQVAADTWRSANLREMRRRHFTALAVPDELVMAEAKATLACELVWRGARADSDWKALLPSLGEVLRLVKEVAAARAEVLGVSPYDALLDRYEPNARAERIDAIFGELASFLGRVLPAVLERQRERGRPVLPPGPFALDRQKALGQRMMEAMGFDFTRGRLDVSHHPFCGGASDDVRITTRYDEADFTSALYGVLHETGHALYEQNLPAKFRYQPVGEARGMSVHESQSLLMEMQACRSREFVRFAAPVLRQAFDGEGPEWAEENLYRLLTLVEPGFIRVESDEVTYPAHIILRYRLERALIEDRLTLAELPGAWNDLSRDLLGLAPPNDRLGCLQDIHWPSGGFGYFPTYTLGAMTAAQLFAAAKQARPEIPEALGRGDFSPLVGWLKTEVHGRASLMSSDEMLTAATGRPLDARAFEAHITARYLT